MADVIAPVVNAETTVSDSDVGSEHVDATVSDVQPQTPKEKEIARKFKLKYGKEEREVDEATAIAMAQKGWAADDRFQKASSKEKEVLSLIEKFKSDPEAFDAFVRKMGHDPIEIYKRQLAKELQRKVMTPEQRELAEAREKLAAFEKNEKARKDKEHQDKVSQLQTHYEQQYDKEMSDAISTSGLPKTPKTIKRLAQLAYKNLQMGLDLPWNALTDMVREEYKADMRDMFGSSDADKLVELFGPDIAKKLAGASLKARVIDPEPVTEKNRSAAKKKTDTSENKYANDDDWDARMKKFKQG